MKTKSAIDMRLQSGIKEEQKISIWNEIAVEVNKDQCK
jgi:hypothetical protein